MKNLLFGLCVALAMVMPASVHNTWDTSIHIISYGDWTEAWLGCANP
ncbi:MAG: hypothetical protein TUN42_03250 [Dehalogenimonas sp.]